MRKSPDLNEKKINLKIQQASEVSESSAVIGSVSDVLTVEIFRADHVGVKKHGEHLRFGIANNFRQKRVK